jgi:hypothetical protein
VGGRKPWCQPDLVSAEGVVEVVRRCPTGALVCERRDGGAGEAPDAKNTVTVMSNGPLVVRGELEIDGPAEEMPGVRCRPALCRCGPSHNKQPFFGGSLFPLLPRMAWVSPGRRRRPCETTTWCRHSILRRQWLRPAQAKRRVVSRSFPYKDVIDLLMEHLPVRSWGACGGRPPGLVVRAILK